MDIGFYKGIEEVSNSKDLPLMLKNVLKIPLKREERGVALVSAITALSSCMPKYHFRHFGKKMFTNIYTLVYGPSGGGKGMISVASEIVKRINDHLLKKHILAIEKWKAEGLKLEENINSKIEIVEHRSRRPKKAKLCIGDDITKAIFVRNIDNAENGCFLQSSEAVQLFNSMKPPHGECIPNYICKIAHHEPLHIETVKDDFDCTVLEPQLTLLLSCTKNQMLDYFNQNHNLMVGGFTSRFLFYEIEYTISKMNTLVAKEQNYDNLADISERVEELYKKLEEREIECVFSEELRKSIDDFWEKKRICFVAFSDLFLPIVKRALLNSYRIIAIFSMLRKYESVGNEEILEIIPTAEDVALGLSMANIFSENSFKMHSTFKEFNGSEIKPSSRNVVIREFTATEFTSTEFIDYCKIEHSIDKDKAKEWLLCGLRDGVIKKNSVNKFVNLYRYE